MAQQQPRVNSDAQKELKKAEEQFQAFDESIQKMTLDNMNKAPKEELESQTKMSKKEERQYDAPVIKPLRSISSKEKYNPAFEKDHRRAWEYVKCVVENKEIIGEQIHRWTKPFPGDPAQEWKIPVNKPIYLPRFLAIELSKCQYHRLVMQENQVTGSDGVGTWIGAMVAETKVNRIDCRPAGFDDKVSGF